MTENFSSHNSILLSTSAFSERGGWTLDQQFIDIMGSSYLLAHGLGRPVADASTVFEAPLSGEYFVWVRTRNWTREWSAAPTPGVFSLLVNGAPVDGVFARGDSAWHWEKGPSLHLEAGLHSLSLHDLTGFEGRCSEILLTTLDCDPSEVGVESLRLSVAGISDEPADMGSYDFVVVGGGVAGMCAAIAAARKGVRVALVTDRKVLGGNNSSEVRVGLGGRLNIGDFQNLGYLLNEFAPSTKGNARPFEVYEDEKKMQAILSEPNITLFAGYRVQSVEMRSEREIASAQAVNVENYSKIKVSGRLWSDCTGDACLAYLAGCETHMGREGRDEFGEPSAPEVADDMTMGASVQWYSDELDHAIAFPDIDWGLEIDERSVQVVRRGQWYWEVGMRDDQIADAEKIRDWGMYVAYSNWAYLKKTRPEYENASLEWLSFIAGKRESRRIMGSFVLREQDLADFVRYPDGCVSTSWYIDQHEPDPDNSALFPGREWLSRGCLTPLGFYPLPFRCFLSKDVDNMMMAGRDISVSHIALGTVRVMRTCAMMGEVVGLAASICTERGVLPNDIYTTYFDDLKELMSEGVGRRDVPYTQTYTLIDTTAARSEDC